MSNNPNGIGGFKPGKSGNPGGRPAELVEVRALARAETEASIGALVKIRDNGKAPASARVAAAIALLDRGWGKPAQALEHSGPGGGPIEHLGMTAEERRAQEEQIKREIDELLATDGAAMNGQIHAVP